MSLSLIIDATDAFRVTWSERVSWPFVSDRIRYRNALIEKALEDAAQQGLGKRFSRHSSTKFETITKLFQQSTLGAVYMEGGRS